MNKKLNCLVVDDAIAEGLALKMLIDKTEFLAFDRLINDPLKALDYLQKQQPDLLFLDIEMPKLSGIELIKSLKQCPPTVLVTSHTDFALEAYELDVIDYLIKPVKYARFLKTITKIATARKETNAPVNQDFFIKVDNKYIRLSESDILFIEGLKDYVMIHTEQDRKYITYATLKYIEEELKNLYQDRFMRIHRSFIINTRKIDFVEETQVYIKDTIISIGATYKQQFFNMMNKL